MTDRINEARGKSNLEFNRLGCSCKLSAVELQRLLSDSGMRSLLISRQPIRINRKSVIMETVDFFHPVSEDPFYQGRISATNVLNDIYAMGVPLILCFSIILALRSDTTMKIARRIITGIKDVCAEVKTQIAGGHTIIAADVLIGGCAIGMEDPRKLVYPIGAKAGDYLVLTKPLGPQLLMMCQYLESHGLLRRGSLPKQSMKKALEIMSHPANRVAEAIHLIGANAATDITGFGLYGHAAQIAENSNVDLIFDCLPVIKGALEVGQMLGKEVEKGRAPETAGGILISVSRESCRNLENELKRLGEPSFLVGRVTEKQGKTGKAVIPPDILVAEV
jgi:selenide,water dikinase